MLRSQSIKAIHWLFWALLVMLFLFSFSAYAACTGLGCSCSVASAPVTFGNYSASTVSDTAGTVSVTCSALLVGLTVSYVISLSTGNSGSFSLRQMQSGAHVLNYNLYTDAGRNNIWGDGTAGSSTVMDSYNVALLSRTIDYTVYARIPAAQFVAAGAYSDSIMVTVEY